MNVASYRIRFGFDPFILAAPLLVYEENSRLSHNVAQLDYPKRLWNSFPI